MVNLTHRGRLEKAVAAAEAAYAKRAYPNGYQAPRTRNERRERAALADVANAARRSLWIASHPRRLSPTGT